MKVYYLDDGIIKSNEYEDIANLEAFEREMDESHEIWAYTKVDLYTAEEQAIIDTINKMSHYDMCSLWRFAPVGHLYFNNILPYADIFKERLFKHFGGFTPEISKSLGH